jgi:SulP family sulfate permease
MEAAPVEPGPPQAAGLSGKTAAVGASSIGPNLVGGALSALVTLSYSLSYGALIFSGAELQPHVKHGLQAALMAAWVIALIVAVGSSFHFAIAGPDSNATAILALMAAFAADKMAKRGAPSEQIIATVLVMLAITAVIVGVVVFLIGAFQRGKLVRFLPYPVIGGFLAGTGFLILGGGFKVLTGFDLTFANIYSHGLNTAPQAWFPTALVATGLFVIPRFQKNVLVLPMVLLGGIGVFYAGLWFSGMSLDGARAAKLMFYPMAPAGGGQTALTSVKLVQWDVLYSQWYNMLAMTIVVIITILLNATGLDLATQTDADIDRELRVNGIANILSGLMGGMIGYLSISRSMLNFKAGANSRTAGYIAAALCLGATFLFTPAVSYFPRPVLAGLLIFLGLSMLREWIWDAYFKLQLFEYEMILAILLLIVLQGLITGIGFGLLIASIFFVYSYSRTSCIANTFNSATHFSNKERALDQTAMLKAQGVHARTLVLQGYIFFGTSNEIVDTCRKHIEEEQLEYLLLDFRRVQGLDASAVSSFFKLEQLCRRYKTLLLLSSLRPELIKELERTKFLPNKYIHVKDDLDRGLEWIEEDILDSAPTVMNFANPMQSIALAERDLRRILESQFSAEALDILIEACETMKMEANKPLFKKGDRSDALYFLERGELTVLLQLDGGNSKRLRSFGPGTVVGEMGLFTGSPRSADVVTSQPSRVRKLTAENLALLEQHHPNVVIEFDRFLIRLMSGRIAAANEEIRGLI